MNRMEKAVTVEYAARIRLVYNELRNAGASQDDIRKRVKALLNEYMQHYIAL